MKLDDKMWKGAFSRVLVFMYWCIVVIQYHHHHHHHHHLLPLGAVGGAEVPYNSVAHARTASSTIFLANAPLMRDGHPCSLILTFAAIPKQSVRIHDIPISSG